MPRKNRLTGVEIRGLRSPRRMHGRLFSLTFAALPTGEPRFAFVVSKKVAARATDRNLIKRRCRAALRDAMEGVPAGSYIFYAKKDAAKATYRELAADIRQLIEGLRSPSH